MEDYNRRKQRGVIVNLNLEKPTTKLIGISLIMSWLKKASVLGGGTGFMGATLLPASLFLLMVLLKVFSSLWGS